MAVSTDWKYLDVTWASSSWDSASGKDWTVVGTVLGGVWIDMWIDIESKGIWKPLNLYPDDPNGK